jgi:hypothetical protein
MDSQPIRWDWNPNKAASNLSKHKVSFELAAEALKDPNQLSMVDDDADEYRFKTLAAVGNVILVIAHTEPELERYSGTYVGRILSARKAEPFERKAYHHG